MDDETVVVPSGLRAASRRWFEAVTSEFEPGPAELQLLEVACRAYDRAEQCRHRVNRDGLMIQDRFGQLKMHPMVAEERAQRDLCRRAIATLKFDVDMPE